MKHVIPNRRGGLAGPSRRCAAKAPAHRDDAASMLHAMERLAAQGCAKPPSQLSAEELGRALSAAGPFAAWLEEARAHALDVLLAGKAVPGWKAVEGRGNRRFTDTAAAFAALCGNGFPEDGLYERRPLSPTQVEKLVGKAAFRRIAGPFVERPLGRPVLAPENDPRSPYPSAVAGTQA